MATREEPINKFMERLQTSRTLVVGGATGTNLHKMGLLPGIAPEDLVVDQPELILRFKSAFAAAGAAAPDACFGWPPGYWQVAPRVVVGLCPSGVPYSERNQSSRILPSIEASENTPGLNCAFPR